MSNSTNFQHSNPTEHSTNVLLIDFNPKSLTAEIITMSILLVGIVANTLLIIAHCKDPLRVFQNTTSLFVRNIAMIDIVVAFIWIIRTIMILIRGWKPATVSAIWVGVVTMSPSAFLCFAIERFISIAFPLWYRVRVKTETCRKAIVGTWITHGVIYTIVFFKSSRKEHFLTIYAAVIFLAVYIFYFATYITLRRQRNKLRKRQDNTADQAGMRARQEQEKRFLVTIAIICIILMILFLPIIGLSTFTILLRSVLKIRSMKGAFICLLVLLSINFVINPIIYLLRLPKYRETFRVLYCNFT